MKKILASSLFAIGFIFTGCSEQTHVTLPNLEFNSKDYQTASKLSNITFGMSSPNLKINTKLNHRLFKNIDKRIQSNTDKIYCELAPELKKIFLSKGFTISQLFNSYNSMTYTEKRNTSALFTPNITINIEENSLTTLLDGRPEYVNGNLSFSASIDIQMKEPLSNELLWIKNIVIPSVSIPVSYKYNTTISNNTNVRNAEYIVPRNVAEAAKTIDSFYVKIYDEIIKETEKHIQVEEFEHLNSDIKKLKDIKRY